MENDQSPDAPSIPHGSISGAEYYFIKKKSGAEIFFDNTPEYHGDLFSGMWITADFRLYPPVITANQELVSPTGDRRYRGGTERAHPRGFRV